jgi:hypothetical protein
MKIAFYAIIFLFCLSPVFSQKTEIRDPGNFSKIEIRNGILVELIPSDKESVKVISEFDLSKIITEIKDSTLIIRNENKKKGKTAIEIYYTGINEIAGFNRSEISASSLMKQDSLIVLLESGAKAYLELDVKLLRSKLNEGSVLTAQGYAVVQDAYSTTGATLSLFDLESDEVTIKITGNGKAKINVEQSLTADVSSGGYLSYKGKPQKWDTKTSLGGKIEEYTE